jgi:hypothetical protein
MLIINKEIYFILFYLTNLLNKKDAEDRLAATFDEIQ